MKLSDCANLFTGDLDMVVFNFGRNIFKVASTMDWLAKGMPSKSSALTPRRCKRVDILAADSQGNPLEESMVYSAETIAREDSTMSLEDSQGEETTPQSSMSGRSSPNILKEILMRHKEEVKASASHRYPVECDGECVGHLPASYEIIPRAIKCRIPKDMALK